MATAKEKKRDEAINDALTIAGALAQAIIARLEQAEGRPVEAHRDVRGWLDAAGDAKAADQAGLADLCIQMANTTAIAARDAQQKGQTAE